jgi:hypothetical protein
MWFIVTFCENPHLIFPLRSSQLHPHPLLPGPSSQALPRVMNRLLTENDSAFRIRYCYSDVLIFICRNITVFGNKGWLLRSVSNRFVALNVCVRCREQNKGFRIMASRNSVSQQETLENSYNETADKEVGRQISSM